MEEKTTLLEETKRTKRSLQSDLDGPIAEDNAAILELGSGLVCGPKLATRSHAQLTSDMRRCRKKQDVQDSLDNTTLEQLG
jgi:hypothetical protein